MLTIVKLLTLFIASGLAVTTSEKCRVVQKTMMTCLQATAEDLPKTTQNKIEWILFTKSNVPVIKKQHIKNFPDLTDFHAEKSGMERIENDAFQGLQSLDWVDVAFNKLTVVSPDLFKDCPKMYTFNLTGNTGLVVPENQPFLNAPKLQWLDLAQANIKQLYAATFKNVPNLKYLSLSQNQLTTLPEKVFENLKVLTSLDLSRNQIKSAPLAVFQPLKTPLVLLLNGNPWECDCALSPVLQWSKKNVVKDDVKCVKPDDRKWKDVVLNCGPKVA